MTTLRDLAELVRAPAALTVPGDSLAGAAAAGWPAGRRTALLPVASTCLYWAGMALNDWADRETDAVERPERPIPSGRVAPDTALQLAAGLTAAGVLTAAYAGGRRAAAVSSLLAAAVWAYDLRAKEGAFSAGAMASTRGLDVLLGASAGGVGGLLRALPAAGLVAAHTAGITTLSRGEVHGTTPERAQQVAGVSAGVALGVVTSLRSGLTKRSRAVALAGAALYAAEAVRAQASVARRPGPASVRKATGSGIQALVPLQGALAAAGGRPLLGMLVGATAPVGRVAMRLVSPT